MLFLKLSRLADAVLRQVIKCNVYIVSSLQASWQASAAFKILVQVYYVLVDALAISIDCLLNVVL